MEINGDGFNPNQVYTMRSASRGNGIAPLTYQGQPKEQAYGAYSSQGERGFS